MFSTNATTRRSLLRGAAGAAFLATARKSGWAQASTARVTVHASQTGGVIRPDLHGHFA